MSFMSTQISDNHQLYHPVNKEKFKGKEGYAVCRSSWETSVCLWLDRNPAIIAWDSEPFGIPYTDSTKRDSNGHFKKRMYYPDFIIKVLNKNGTHDIWMIEVKPYKETIQPKKGKKKIGPSIIKEDITWIVNSAKWKAAKAYCDRKGWQFRILTERDIRL